jgi:hypothetical protein
MLNIRTVILSVMLVLVLLGAMYSAVVASPAASSPSVFICPVVHSSAASFSIQELRDILNGRYEHRVGLPR